MKEKRIGRTFGEGEMIWYTTCPICEKTELREDSERDVCKIVVRRCKACDRWAVRDLGWIDGMNELARASWHEANLCLASGAYTASMTMCRKLITHMACDRAGGTTDDRFVKSIERLEEEGFIAPQAMKRLEEMKDAQNDAVHQLESTTEEEAKELLGYIEAWLKAVYLLAK